MTKQCFFCSQNVHNVNYKEVETLQRFISGQAKIIRPLHTGVCTKHQRQLSRAIKRARHAGLLPFTRR